MKGQSQYLDLVLMEDEHKKKFIDLLNVRNRRGVLRAFGIENEADIKHIENVIAESRTQAKVSRHLALMVIEGFGEDPAEYGFTKEKPALAQYSTTLLLKEIFRRINT